MENPYAGYRSSTEKYDEMMNKASMALNDAAFIYETFLTDLLNIIGQDILLPSVIIPVYNGDTYELACVELITLDPESQLPSVGIEGGRKELFQSLNVSAQDLICQTVYMEIKTADMRRQMFPGEIKKAENE